MAELFVEIFSEEIPARMQAKARVDFERLVCGALKSAGLDYDNTETYTTPRRLVIKVDGVPEATADVSEERRGPRVDAPEKAIEGFLRSTGLNRDDLVERESKKGTFLYAVIEKEGGPSSDVIAEFMPGIIHNFPWPKSQRWGTGALHWVRPLHSILALFDGAEVKFKVDDIESGTITQGHRFMAPEDIHCDCFAEYKRKLREAAVILDHNERAEIIREKCIELTGGEELDWVEDEGLLTEVAGLVEYPVPMMGSFDPAFMEVPEEVLILTMKKDQKYFVTRDPKRGKLAPYFITVANIAASDGGNFIRSGNERVLSARLADAKFFWDQDLKSKLEDNLPKLADIVFHDKLGTVAERVDRIKALSGYLAKEIGCDVKQAERAAELSKADLVSNMVGEFADLQGIMGRYYALKAGEDEAIANAISDHYAPKGPDDNCPSAPVSVAVALAEKIDTLVGFFGADMKPTGSKDPFALRRAALGIIRLITENDLRLNLAKIITIHHELKGWRKYFGGGIDYIPKVYESNNKISKLASELIAFISDRLKVQQREKGVRHDLIDAAGSADDLVLLLSKVDALSHFISTDDGENLLAGYKRASNILRIEEKKDKTSYNVDVDVKLLSAVEEIELNNALAVAQSEAEAALGDENFAGAMKALSKLRAPTDAFFDKVTVNDENATVRTNRLALLSSIKSSIDKVADFSQIEG